MIAATNLPETLDPALKRPGRFDRQVAVPLPDIRGRTQVLEYYLGDKPVDTAVDRDLLARQTQGETSCRSAGEVHARHPRSARDPRPCVTHMPGQALPSGTGWLAPLTAVAPADTSP